MGGSSGSQTEGETEVARSGGGVEFKWVGVAQLRLPFASRICRLRRPRVSRLSQVLRPLRTSPSSIYFPSFLGLFSSACNQYLARGNIPLTTSPPPLSTCLMQSALQFPSHFSHFFLITRKTHNKINRGEWKTFVLPCRKICKDFDQLNSCCCCCCFCCCCSCSFWQLYDTNNCWKWLGIQMCCALLITAVLLLFI